MGRWGSSLFQSDLELDFISDTSREAGLKELEKQAYLKLQAQQAEKGEEAADPTGKEAPKRTLGELTDDNHYDLCYENGINFSICAYDCSDITLVREHLDSGALQDLIDQKKAKKQDGWDIFNTNHQLVLIGACAMSLGCKFPVSFKEWLIKSYRSVGLMRKACFQMQVALGDSPRRYKEGEPYEFGSKGLLDTMNSLDDSDDEDEPPKTAAPGKSFIFLNVGGPFGMTDTDQGRPTKQYPHDVCGGCGAKERFDAKDLLVCGKCHIKKYCGKVCQQAHFKEHKKVCKA